MLDVTAERKHENFRQSRSSSSRLPSLFIDLIISTLELMVYFISTSSTLMLRAPTVKLGDSCPARALRHSRIEDFPELFGPVMIVIPLPGSPLGTAKLNFPRFLNPRKPRISMLVSAMMISTPICCIRMYRSRLVLTIGSVPFTPAFSQSH